MPAGSCLGMPQAKKPKTQRKKLRLDLAYLGTNYCGWQKQQVPPCLSQYAVRPWQGDERSVFEALQDALTAATGCSHGPCAAGRTDKGVHAAHQASAAGTSQAARELEG